jgi:hypothetical protein
VKDTEELSTMARQGTAEGEPQKDHAPSTFNVTAIPARGMGDRLTAALAKIP